MSEDIDDLRREYQLYDSCVDIVSAAEVWFTKASGIRDTVLHFERYPVIAIDEGIEVTPDFTVLFRDSTAYVGEISSLSLEAGSLDSLCAQIGRYDALTEIPGPRGTTVAVSAIDVLLFVPHGESIAAISRIAKATADEDHPYSPTRFPSVFAWSTDARGKYTFTLDRRAPNQAPRGHGRPASLETWLNNDMNPDTLTGLPKNFWPFKSKARFMNDPVPKLYMATLLWSEVFPNLLGGEGDLQTSPAELAAVLRERYGRGRANDVRPALVFLEEAGLAVRDGERWTIGASSISRHAPNVVETLLERYAAKPKGPVTLAAKEQARADRQVRERNASQQTRFPTSSE